METPLYLHVGFAQHVVSRELSNISSEMLLDFQCCVSFIPSIAIAVVSLSFVFSGLEQ